MKTCNACGESKPLDDFPKNARLRDGHVGTCTLCVNRRRRELSVDPERKTKKSYYNRKTYLTRHGLTIERFEEMLAEQGGVCASCETDIWGRKDNMPSVDHDHKHCSGKYGCAECVRGLLCIRCNVFASYLESPLRTKVEAYLERTSRV